MRDDVRLEMLDMGVILAGADDEEPDFFPFLVSCWATRVFQLLHSGHLPYHEAEVVPHEEHK